MTTHPMHPMHPLTTDPKTGDTYYQGDLAAGQALVTRDRWPYVRIEQGGVLVMLCDSEPTSDDDAEGKAAEWGGGPDVDTAWRFALGAAMGPMDAEYDESRLIALLQVVSR